MTTPEPTFDISNLVPKRYKPLVGFIGALLTLLVPYLISVQTSVSAPWSIAIGVVLAALTALGIDQTPYKPKGTVLAPDTPAVAAATAQAVLPTSIVTPTMAVTPPMVFRSGPPWT